MGIFIGIFLIAMGATLSWAAEATATGRVGMNSSIGIRVGYVTHSPEAWLEGHRAARTLIHCNAAVLVVAGVVALFPAFADIASWIAIAASLICLGLMLPTVKRANQAAERVALSTGHDS
ncbi:SdpI family protein [Arthrobacter sp. 08Y14]|uniref:SdpI family protein n=1 Tax=Arthrobacter sp. 08Y14 TaxID=2058885 RepID=UPI000CE32911|nr:SdpI family protein [Arthrobacter sp. 08Y14]